MSETLGTRVRRTRAFAGLTQAALGALVGMSGPTISRIEHDERFPMDAALTRLDAWLQGQPVPSVEQSLLEQYARPDPEALSWPRRVEVLEQHLAGLETTMDAVCHVLALPRHWRVERMHNKEKQ